MDPVFPTSRTHTPLIVGLQSGKTIQRVYFSYNLLLERFAGADGFKTGFVCASGYNFVGSATRSGRRIAAIVLGRDGQTSRAVDAARLITEGFEKPLAFGTPIERLSPNGPVAAQVRDMRSTICTDAAQAARYDPGAGQAVIDSPWLQKRTITRGPLVATLEPSATLGFQSVTFPKFRPSVQSFAPAATLEKADAIAQTIATTPPAVLKPTIDALIAELAPAQSAQSPQQGAIPLPTFRLDPR